MLGESFDARRVGYLSAADRSMTPKLSVLVPVRNAASTLDEALRSVARQTFEDWEAILVDDGSTDDTPALLQQWTKRDSRFRLFSRDRHAGIEMALNLALEYARGEISARMDADDIADPRRFEWQFERLSEGDVDVVGCRVRYFPEEAVQDGARRYEAWLNSLITPEEHERDLFVECPLAHPTLMMRTETLRRLVGYRVNRWPEDYDLLLRLALAGGRMAKVPDVLLHWREGELRSSRTQPQYALERFPRLRAHYLVQRELQERPALIFGAGRVGKAHAKAILEAGGKIAAFVDLDPRKIGQRPYGIPVLAQSEAVSLRGGPYGLGALAQPGQREELRKALYTAGWREPQDFRCIA
jgi:glycosyltransferase involved in cell wall biosynthesis